jgi:hypothetical protein
MRIARHGAPGAERPLISGPDSEWFDLTAVTQDVTPEFLSNVLDGGMDGLRVRPRA